MVSMNAISIEVFQRGAGAGAGPDPPSSKILMSTGILPMTSAAPIPISAVPPHFKAQYCSVTPPIAISTPLAHTPTPPYGFSHPSAVTSEVPMYGPFIEAANFAAPSLQFLDTHSTSLAPDVSAYKESDQPLKVNQTDFSRMELFVEFKFEDNADPFADPEDPSPFKPTNDFERVSDAALALTGQLSSYTAALSGSQFRLHVFTILICGKLARLIYWNCNGAIVSHAFNCTKYKYLRLFLQHYNQDVYRRGHDPSVTIPDKQTIKKVALYDQERLVGYNDNQFRIMLIPDRGEATKESRFIISYPPKYTNHSPFGRATRPMVTYDPRFVFGKDYWRLVGSDKEGDINKLLVDNIVPHIASFGEGNDVRNNVTDKLEGAIWACPTCDMVALCNYRMLLDEVGRPLIEFESSEEFVGAVADAMKAHDTAFFDAGILHRDISIGNVIITAGGEGVLIDWDLCINYRKQDMTAHRPERTGTWQFMSAALLSQLRSDQKIEDDRESAFWVLLYLGLRYTKHNQVQKLEPYMNIFDYVAFADNVAKGGQLKSNFLISYGDAGALTFQCSPLNDLIKELRTTFSVRYKDKPSAAAFARYEKMKRNSDIFAVALVDNTAAQYEAHQKKLGERGWLVNVIHKHLDDADWPTADAAKLNDTSKKRKREEKKQKSS